MLIILGLSTNLRAQDYPGPFKILGKSLKTIPQESKAIAFYPFKNPNKTIKFAGISLALIVVDKPTTTFTQHALNHTFDVRFKRVFPLFKGRDGYIMGGLFALYTGSVAFKYQTGQEAALAATKATFYSYIYTHLILKSLFARLRPLKDLNNPAFADAAHSDNNWSFGHFHTPRFKPGGIGTGFPSFHITYAFAVARALERSFHNTFFPYAFAVGLNVVNFYGHDHWVSDMVAGALVGHMIGTMATGGYKDKKLGKGFIKPNVSFATNPFTYQQYPTLGLIYRF